MKLQGVFLVVLGILVIGCGSGNKAVTQDHEQEMGGSAQETDLLHKPDPVGTYGSGLTGAKAISIASLLAEPERHEGQLVSVSGTVHEVCPRRGCWMDMVDASGNTIQIKVVDGEIVFPLSAVGHKATAEGIVQRLELDEEQAMSYREHEAEERGEAFDPEAVDPGPLTIWRIKGDAAEIGE